MTRPSYCMTLFGVWLWRRADLMPETPSVGGTSSEDFITIQTTVCAIQTTIMVGSVAALDIAIQSITVGIFGVKVEAALYL
ncbi:hypothetical protein CHS0354_015097, partial [Potamilus streckersoni]